MHLENQPTLNSLSAESGASRHDKEDTGQDAPATAGSGSLLSEHKGKLAIGAAAMLGLAVFYKWRESRLAKEDPKQYAQLRRIKSAIEHDGGSPSQQRRKTEQGDTE